MTENTLRDQFAMAALTGMCANPSTTGNWDAICDVLPRMAYILADAMVEKSRQKPKANEGAEK